jgi:hypothetical protein
MSSCIVNLSRENVLRTKMKRRKRRKRKEEKRFDIRYTFYIDQNNIIYPQPFFT